MPAPPAIPAVPNDRWWIAVSVPSFFAPRRTVMRAAGALPVQRCSSCRSSIILTAAPACLASLQATPEKFVPSAEAASLLPNPPPMCSVMTVTFLRSMPRYSAMPSRTVDMLWVEAQIVSWSPSHFAITPCVSSGECVCTGT